MAAASKAILGSTGIMIQFPLYAGIMGIMNYSGLLAVFADFFINISNHNTFPFFAYLSSAVVNVLVPSGGGQWAGSRAYLNGSRYQVRCGTRQNRHGIGLRRSTYQYATAILGTPFTWHYGFKSQRYFTLFDTIHRWLAAQFS